MVTAFHRSILVELDGVHAYNTAGAGVCAGAPDGPALISGYIVGRMGYADRVPTPRSGTGNLTPETETPRAAATDRGA